MSDDDARPRSPGLRRRLEALGVRPYKGWGQNFLVDTSVPRRMVEVAAVQPGEVVVEVGPGLGVLTEPLLAAGARVVAIEIDPRLAVHLREQFGAMDNFQLVESDILAVEPERLAPSGEPYKVVANLPYSVTSAVLRHLLSRPRRPTRLVVMVQREVAERIVAEPPAMSLLAVSIQFFGSPRLALRVPAGAFYPAPSVDSAVVALEVEDLPLPDDEQPAFFRVVAAGFGQRRKTLSNSLMAGLALPRPAIQAALAAAELDPRRRAETLTVADWVRLYRTIRASATGVE